MILIRMDRSFQLGVDYIVSRNEQALFTWQCSSVQQGPNQMGKDGALIRKGIADACSGSLKRRSVRTPCRPMNAL